MLILGLLVIGGWLKNAAVKPLKAYDAETVLGFMPMVIGSDPSKATRTPTATIENTQTATSTPTNSSTPEPTATMTFGPTSSPTMTNTPVPTVTPSSTATPTATASNTPVPSATASSTATPTATATNTTIPTATATNTPEPTATNTPVGVATATSTIVPTPTATTDPGQEGWWDTRWHFRLPLSIKADGAVRTDKTAEIRLNFTTLLQSVGETNRFALNSIRVIEVDTNNVIVDNAVPFQFDPDADYNGFNNAQGTLNLLMAGVTPGNGTRFYHIYFDIVGSFDYPPPDVQPLVIAKDNKMDEGFASFQFNTAIGTYFYHKDGGGFSSLNDKNGKDWINYSTATGSAGDYRGIPNLVPPASGGFFHPGRTGVSSQLINSGPLKATFESQVLDAQSQVLWDLKWEIFHDTARMTMIKANTNYWFLFEGTPGGTLEVNQDYMVLANKAQYLTSDKWTMPLTNGEWLYFVDPTQQRSLYLVHHEADNLTDSYSALNDEMTVFGFGRKSVTAYMNQTQTQFSFGLVDAVSFNDLQTAVNNVTLPMTFNTSSVETNP